MKKNRNNGMKKLYPHTFCQILPLENELLTVLNIHRTTNCQKHVYISDSIVECIPNAHPEIIGKSAKMKFVDKKEQEQWYEGIIFSYNVITGKYSVYFSYDGVTEEVSYDDEDMEIID